MKRLNFDSRVLYGGDIKTESFDCWILFKYFIADDNNFLDYSLFLILKQ